MSDVSIDDEQKESERLEREVLDVEAAPRSYAKREPERDARDSDNASGKRQRSNNIAPRPKLMSTIAAVVSPSHGDSNRSEHANDRWDPNDDAAVHAAKPVPREVEQRPDNVNRNRRMLGALMGHLNTARRNLEKDSTIKVQECVKSSVVEKNREHSRVASREISEKEAALRDELLAKQTKNDIALATACWKKNMLQTQSFCVTDTEPRLAWLPGIVDGMVSKYIDTEKRKKEVESLIAEREESDQKMIKAVDDEMAEKKARRLADRESAEAAAGGDAAERSQDTVKEREEGEED